MLYKYSPIDKLSGFLYKLLEFSPFKNGNTGLLGALDILGQNFGVWMLLWRLLLTL